MASGLKLTALASKMVGLGLTLAGDIKVTATLHLGKAQAYDFETDRQTSSGGTDPTTKGLLYRPKQTQGNADSIREMLLLVDAKDAPAGITEADKLTIDTDEWNINEVEPLPGNAGYILHLRR